MIMESSQQSVMLRNPSGVHVSPKSGSSSEVHNTSNSTWDIGVNRNQNFTAFNNSEEVIGVVEVFVHQARDIHNICIYHKQDVYAKLCLTSDPNATASTQTINGGGQSPVFNENLSLNVRSIDASIKCEIWMLSRVRNYLEDQLLGFALVPLSDVLNGSGGKLSQEFMLSSTDLFHSPAGFVQLSLSYIGAAPDVLEVSAPFANGNDLVTRSSPKEELEKLEFPDPNLLNENHLMVTEYFELSANDLNSPDSHGLVLEAKGDQVKPSDSESVEVSESFSGNSNALKPLVEASRAETITSSISTNESPTLSANESASSHSVSETTKPAKGKLDAGEAESGSSNMPTLDSGKPAASFKVVPEETVVQQDYVDMYLKSMQQFTESLAKMKLPMDMEKNSGTSAPDSNSLASSNGKGPKVFYGSRAFF